MPPRQAAMSGTPPQPADAPHPLALDGLPTGQPATPPATTPSLIASADGKLTGHSMCDDIREPGSRPRWARELQGNGPVAMNEDHLDPLDDPEFSAPHLFQRPLPPTPQAEASPQTSSCEEFPGRGLCNPMCNPTRSRSPDRSLPDLLHAIYGPAAPSRPVTADEL
jgi:hypothetical protein